MSYTSFDNLKWTSENKFDNFGSMLSDAQHKLFKPHGLPAGPPVPSGPRRPTLNIEPAKSIKR